MSKKKFKVKVAPGTPPEPSYVTKAKCIDVHDADTITVEVRRVFSIRLGNTSKAELDTELGLKLQKTLEEQLLNKEVVVQIPFGTNEKLMDFNSFERVVGFVWCDGKLID
jgi:hypothetical protein